MNTKERELFISDFNKITGKRVRKIGVILDKLIKAGHTSEDILGVVSFKSDQWKNNKTMNKYLRPSTLLNIGKFERYLYESNSEKDTSKGEYLIAKTLYDNNTKFQREYEVEINGHKRRFDFKVDNMLIEFDGIQHFKDGIFKNQSLARIQEADRIKNDWAINSGFKLIRISYKMIVGLHWILKGDLDKEYPDKLTLIGEDYI